MAFYSFFRNSIIDLSFLVIITPLLSVLGMQASANAGKGGDSSLPVANDVLFRVNAYRESKGLAVLQLNAVISLEAQKHSMRMASKEVPFGHDGFGDRVRLISQRLGPLRSCAENVAHGNFSPEEVINSWLKSPGHRKNIEGKYTLTGIGVAKGKDGTLYFTQIFTMK